jgi:ribose transport system permease protein
VDAVGQEASPETGRHASVRGKRYRIPAIYFAIALLMLMVVLFTMGNRNFLSSYNLNTIASYSAILLIVGLGQMCTILIGGIDLSVGGLMSFISVLFVISLKAVGFWAFPFCIVAGIIVGYLNGNILTRIKIPSFIATLGTGGILTSVALLVSPLPVDVPAPRLGMLDIVNGATSGIPNLLIVTLAIFVLFSVILRFTIVGRNIYYVGSNIRMSWMSGIDVAGTRNFAFALSGFAAAVAGIMISCGQFGGDPTLGKVYILQSIAAVVVGGTALTGGTGGVLNTMVGALTLGVMENGMNVVAVDPYFQQSILGLVIIVSVALTFDRVKVGMIK